MNPPDGSGDPDEALAAILRAIHVLSPSSFSFAGQVVNVSDYIAAPSPHGLALHPLVSRLRDSIYAQAFTRRFQAVPVEEPSPVQDHDFLGALSRANTGRERWDTGWLGDELLPSGQLLAHKGARTRAFWPGEFISLDAPGMPPGRGSAISVYCSRESWTLQPAFYFAFGETLFDEQDDAWLTRFYWNTRAEGAPGLIKHVTSTLNRFQVPFRFKCLAAPQGYWRIDAAVLYVPRRMTRSVAETLSDIHAQCVSFLDAETPLFTRRLAPGLAFAEDPGNGESFGANRSRLIAEAVWMAYVSGSQTLEARLDEIRRHFARGGLDYAHPYLGAGAREDYEFPPFPARGHGQR